MGWYEAEHHCNAWGGHLTSIHSQEYDDLIHSTAMNEVNTNKYWIGNEKFSKVFIILKNVKACPGILQAVYYGQMAQMYGIQTGPQMSQL